MTKRYTVGDEIYDYPDEGDINYAEDATGWAGSITEIAAEVRNAGDIAPTEVTLTGSDTGDHIEGLINNLLFDLAFVQRIEVKGFLTRSFSDATPTKVESFSIIGSYNGSDLSYTVEFGGNPDNITEVEFTNTAGQFGFKYLKINNTQDVKIKYSAKTLIDEEFFA